VRVHELGQAVAASEEAAARARREREQKEAEVTSWEAEVSGCYADYAEAARRAQNPGTAPGMPAIAPGVGRISDLDKETRDLIGAVVLLTAAAGLSGNSPAVPDKEAILKDQTRFRMIKTSNGRGVLLPPRMP
jgi:NTP pyrophosphatase (non-canonical NTP hydrolase)